MDIEYRTEARLNTSVTHLFCVSFAQALCKVCMTTFEIREVIIGLLTPYCGKSPMNPAEE